MTKIIRNNQKFVLAGLMILSMMTFVVSRGSGNGANDRGDQKFGTIGGKTVYLSEMIEAKAEISAMRANLISPDGKRNELQFFVQKFADKPELFFLLRHEARALNLPVNKDDALSVMANLAPQLQPDADAYDATYAGVSDYIRIMNRFNRVADAIKVAKPQADRTLVEQFETIQANLVQINAQDFLTKVAPPTTQQVQDQFTKYASVLPPHPATKENPFGFGYKQPMMMKLQYLKIPAETLTANVVGTKSAYDWEVAAQKYFLLHSDEFKSTTQPATSQTPPPTFAGVRDQVMQKIRQPLLTALLEQVQGYVTSTLNTDYQAYTTAINNGTQPSAVPDSSLGVAYTSYSYLSKLIAKVQQKFNVVLVAGDSPDNLTEQQVTDLPGVGTADVTSFIKKQADDYLAQVDAKDPHAAGLLYRPSVPMQASQVSASMVIVRLTDAVPAQAPANVQAVIAQVTSDLKLQAAYELAKQQAGTLLTAANNGTLLSAAQTAGRQVIALDSDSALSITNTDVKGVFPPLADAAPAFMTQAFNLLCDSIPKTNPHPAATIELPSQSRVFTIQATFVNAGWNAESYFRDAFSAGRESISLSARILFSSWFDLDTTTKRLDYKPIKSKNG